MSNYLDACGVLIDFSTIIAVSYRIDTNYTVNRNFLRFHFDSFNGRDASFVVSSSILMEGVFYKSSEKLRELYPDVIVFENQGAFRRGKFSFLGPCPKRTPTFFAAVPEEDKERLRIGLITGDEIVLEGIAYDSAFELIVGEKPGSVKIQDIVIDRFLDF